MMDAAPGCLSCLMGSDGDMDACMSEEAAAEYAAAAASAFCSSEDAACFTAPRTYTCTWPEWAGEQPDDITCEQSSQEAGSGGLQHRQLRWRERWLLQFEPCPLLHRRPFRRVHDVHAVSRR